MASSLKSYGISRFIERPFITSRLSAKFLFTVLTILFVAPSADGGGITSRPRWKGLGLRAQFLVDLQGGTRILITIKRKTVDKIEKRETEDLEGRKCRAILWQIEKSLARPLQLMVPFQWWTCRHKCLILSLRHGQLMVMRRTQNVLDSGRYCRVCYSSHWVLSKCRRLEEGRKVVENRNKNHEAGFEMEKKGRRKMQYTSSRHSTPAKGSQISARTITNNNCRQ